MLSTALLSEIRSFQWTTSDRKLGEPHTFVCSELPRKAGDAPGHDVQMPDNE